MVQPKLIDIQESPSVLTADHEQNPDQKITLSLSPRRHSLQEDFKNSNFFEQQFAQHIQNFKHDTEWNDTHHHIENRRFQANALHWLQRFNVMRDKCQYDTIPQRRFKTNLRKTSSENELLLMSPSNDQSIGELPVIRRSFSSGLLFRV